MKKFCTTLIGILLLSVFVNANTEEVVTSILGGAPYLIVYQDSVGSSKREPGIYVRSDKGNEWVLIIPGTVLQPKVTGGVSMQLSAAKLTRRFEALSIVDSKPVLFSVQSQKSDPNTYVAIGHDNYSVFNPIDGSYFTLPPIKDVKDISLFAGDPIKTAQGDISVVFMSVKHPTVLGSGITLGLAFKISDNLESKMILQTSPILLDWSWNSTAELGRKIISQGTNLGFFSTNAVSQFTTPNPTDHPILTTWRGKLKDDIKNNSPYDQSIPYYDILLKKINIAALPHTGFSVSRTIAGGIIAFNPFTGQPVMFSGRTSISLHELGEVESLLPTGCLDCAINGVPAFKNLPSEISNGQAVFVSVLKDKTLVLVGTNNHTNLSSLHIKPSAGSVKDITDVGFTAIPDTTYFLVSWKSPGFIQTELLDIQPTNTGFRIINNAILSGKFYDSQNLGFRINRFTNDGVLAFDDITPIVSSADDYNTQHRLTLPHIHIIQTLKQSSPQYYHPQALERHRITESLEYRVYETTSNTPVGNPTGFYIKKDNEVKQVLAAQLLAKKEGGLIVKQTTSMSLDISPFERFELTFAVVDKTFSHAQADHEIVVIAQPPKIDDPVAVTEIGMAKMKLESLESVSAFPNPNYSKDHSKHYFVIVAKYAGKGYFIYPIALHKDSEGKWGLIAQDNHDLVSDSLKVGEISSNIKPEELKFRIRFGKDGSPYWILTPELQISDDGFKFIDLRDRTILSLKTRPEAFDAKEFGNHTYKKPASWLKDKDKEEKGEKGEKINKRHFGSVYRTDIFLDFKKLLDDLSNPKIAPRRVVLIVPDDIKDYAEKYPFALKARDKGGVQNWNDRRMHEPLKLYMFDPKTSSQEEVMENLSLIREEAIETKFKPVFFSTLSALRSAKRPNPAQPDSKDILKLQTQSLNDVKLTSDQTHSNSETFLPHILYLITNEGQKVSLQDYLQRKNKTPSFSQFFIGTESEWKELLSISEDQEHQFNLEKDFEVVTLQPPTQEVRRAFIADIFARPEIQSLGYELDIKSFVQNRDTSKMTPDEIRQVISKYYVNRAEILSKDNGMPVFNGFMSAVNVLLNELQTNSRLRKNRRIDRGALESILSKEFPMLLNLDLLPESDPLRILKRPDAIFLWQQAGYLGKAHLKQGIIDAVLSQLNNVRTTSSSVLLVGDSGSGKTAIFEKLFKMLGLKEYSVKAGTEENQGAQALILKMADIHGSKSDSNGGSSMSEETAMRILDNVLSSENGHRAFILFDDIHQASPDVRMRFIKKIRHLLDSSTYITSGGKEIPTRNLAIFMTMNFTTDLKQIEKFAKDKNNPTKEELILATLSTNDENLEYSFLKRINKILNVNNFTPDAKSPQLVKSATEATQKAFINSQIINFVNSEAVQKIVNRFPNEDARTFLAAAVSSIVKMDQEKGRLIIVTPKQPASAGTFIRPILSLDSLYSENDTGAKIEKFIEQNIDRISLDGSFRGKLEFMKFILDNTRKRALETIINAMNEDPRFVGTPSQQHDLGAPTARALYDHLQTVPHYVIADLELDPLKFGAINRAEKIQFRSALKGIIESQKETTVSLPKVGIPPMAAVFEEFASGHTQTNEVLTRQHVLKQTVERLEKHTKTLMLELLRLPDLQKLPTTTQWLNSLEKNEPNLVKSVGVHLIAELLVLYKEIFSSVLKESIEEASNPAKQKLSQYDAARLYAMAIDRSLASLPWGELTLFMTRALNEATQDLSFGQSTGLQHFLFDSKTSPLITVDSTMVTGNAQSMPRFSEVGKPTPERLGARFKNECHNFLSQLDGDTEGGTP